MAGGAQADGSACQTGCGHLQPAERAVRRPVPPAGRGCGAVLLGGADRGGRARTRRCRSHVRYARTRTEWGLMVLPDISMTNYREAIVALAARHQVPAIYPFRFFA